MCIDALCEKLALARALPGPHEQFGHVVDRRSTEQGTQLDLEYAPFFGVTLAQATHQLTREGRCFPLDVWLAAVELHAQCFALEDRLPWLRVLPSLGVEVSGRLRMALHGINRPFDGLAIRHGDARSDLVEVPRAQVLRDECEILASIGSRLAFGWTKSARRTGQLADFDVEFLVRSFRADLCQQVRAREIVEVFQLALAKQFESPHAFMEAIRNIVRVARAPAERLASFIVGAAPNSLRDAFDRLASEPEFLPPAWRNGGLQVMQDRFTEHLAQPEDFSS